MKRIMMAVAVLSLVAGCGGAKSGGTTAEAVPVVEVKVTEDGFTPAMVNAPRGKAATLVITRVTDKTCATSAVFKAPDGRRFELPLNQAVRIELAAERPDTLRYACSMDMYQGAVVSK
jgi:plastocyanin domain-containing protein